MFVFLVGFLLLTTSINGNISNERLSVLKERVRLLERRLSEDIYILRKEFYSEIGSLSNSDDVVTVPKDENTEKGITNTKSVEKLERRIQLLFSQIDVLKNGFHSEKIFRRDIEHQIKLEQLKTIDIVTTLSAIGSNITSTFDRIELHEVIVQIDEIKQLLEKLNVVDNAIKEPREMDCLDLLRKGHMTSGVYEIYQDTMWRPLSVYCDMEIDGGGWTVFQRRCDGSEEFYRSWNDYRFGFGNLSSEFWLGNEYLHRVTRQAPQELRIELEDFENDRRYAKYALFEIKSAEDLFQLHVEDFSGNVTDSLITTHNDRPFSTHDRGPSSRCSKSYKGGFWYNNCHGVNINGKYLKGEHKSYADGINWADFRGYHYSLKFTEMKFRSK